LKSYPRAGSRGSSPVCLRLDPIPLSARPLKTGTLPPANRPSTTRPRTGWVMRVLRGPTSGSPSTEIEGCTCSGSPPVVSSWAKPGPGAGTRGAGVQMIWSECGKVQRCGGAEETGRWTGSW
jgi:hypothetical protein